MSIAATFGPAGLAILLSAGGYFYARSVMNSALRKSAARSSERDGALLPMDLPVEPRRDVVSAMWNYIKTNNPSEGGRPSRKGHFTTRDSRTAEPVRHQRVNPENKN